MELQNYERQLAELEKKKSALVAREKQIKAKMSGEKRKKENHTKMVLGGAVYGVLKDKTPDDRKQLDLYGRALKKVFEQYQDKLGAMIDSEYQRLQNEHAQTSNFASENSDSQNYTVQYSQTEA